MPTKHRTKRKYFTEWRLLCQSNQIEIEFYALKNASNINKYRFNKNEFISLWTVINIYDCIFLSFFVVGINLLRVLSKWNIYSNVCGVQARVYVRYLIRFMENSTVALFGGLSILLTYFLWFKKFRFAIRVLFCAKTKDLEKSIQFIWMRLAHTQMEQILRMFRYWFMILAAYRSG